MVFIMQKILMFSVIKPNFQTCPSILFLCKEILIETLLSRKLKQIQVKSKVTENTNSSI